MWSTCWWANNKLKTHSEEIVAVCLRPTSDAEYHWVPLRSRCSVFNVLFHFVSLLQLLRLVEIGQKEEQKNKCLGNRMHESYCFCSDVVTCNAYNSTWNNPSLTKWVEHKMKRIQRKSVSPYWVPEGIQWPIASVCTVHNDSVRSIDKMRFSLDETRQKFRSKVMFGWWCSVLWHVRISDNCRRWPLFLPFNSTSAFSTQHVTNPTALALINIRCGTEFCNCSRWLISTRTDSSRLSHRHARWSTSLIAIVSDWIIDCCNIRHYRLLRSRCIESWWIIREKRGEPVPATDYDDTAAASGVDYWETI